jgi:hypothetical protein
MGHIFLVADAQFLALQRPLFSLYVLLIYSPRPVPFIGCIGWLLPHGAPIYLVVLPI